MLPKSHPGAVGSQGTPPSTSEARVPHRVQDSNIKILKSTISNTLKRNEMLPVPPHPVRSRGTQPIPPTKSFNDKMLYICSGSSCSAGLLYGVRSRCPWRLRSQLQPARWRHHLLRGLLLWLPRNQFHPVFSRPAEKPRRHPRSVSRKERRMK